MNIDAGITNKILVSKYLNNQNMQAKQCIEGKIVNPKTNRCVKIDGRIGKALLNSKQPKMQSLLNLAKIAVRLKLAIKQRQDPEDKAELQRVMAVLGEDNFKAYVRHELLIHKAVEKTATKKQLQELENLEKHFKTKVLF